MKGSALRTLGALVIVGFLGLAGNDARAGYFVDALASSPLATYLFGDVSQSTAAVADSTTDYFDGNGNELFAHGFAQSDLSTGILHARATADYGYSGACPTCDPLFPIGNASFGDSLTFLGTFSNVPVTFTATVDGTWSGNCGTDCVGPGAATFQLLVLPGGTIDAHAGNELDLFSNAANQVDVGPAANLPVTVNVSALLNGVDPTLDIAADLDIFGLASVVGQTFDGDFTHSAHLSFSAPPNVTVVSASGLFPNTVAASVPEPATLYAALAGLVALGCTRRREGSARRMD